MKTAIKQVAFYMYIGLLSGLDMIHYMLWDGWWPDRTVEERIFMDWLSKLERKYGKYAINNITLYLIICYAFGYALQLFNPEFMYQYMTLNPYAILHGQVWRLVTWLVIPPYSFDIFTLVTLYFYFWVGSSLERTWGTFRYNVYLISGMLFTILGAFLYMGIFYLLGGGQAFAAVGGAEQISWFFWSASMYFSTYYVSMSIMLAFAITYPEVQVLFMFILPLKVKILGIIYALIIGYDFIRHALVIYHAYRDVAMYGGSGSILMAAGSLAACFAIVFSLLSCIIFFVTTRRSFRTPKQLKRQHEYKKKVVHAQRISRHKCAICGRSEQEYPDLEFRFCSKCNGNYEYCSDHLFTHRHVE